MPDLWVNCRILDMCNHDGVSVLLSSSVSPHSPKFSAPSFPAALMISAQVGLAVSYIVSVSSDSMYITYDRAFFSPCLFSRLA